MSKDAEVDYVIRVMRVKNANGEERTLQFPVRLDLDRPKRSRTTFNEQQLRALDDAYRKNGYLTGERRVKLAEELGLTDTQIKVWFQNRRTKDRKKKQDKAEDEEPSNNISSTPSPTSSSSNASIPPLSAFPSSLATPLLQSHLIPASLPILTFPFPPTIPFSYPPTQLAYAQMFQN